MMLRASIELGGDNADLDGLTDPEVQHLIGVAGSEVLIRFCDAFMSNDEATLTAARDAFVAELGDEALVDAAGVVSNFQRMVRIADATGIPLDPPMAGASVDLRKQLGISNYTAAANTRELPFFKRMFLNTFGRRIFQRIVGRASQG